ncbi:MAG: 1-pyrroline-5-carboxylate dehydrogenase [Bdellovibrionaceae bacterium]|nr:1-pyrroline-5-carboxylate dehydrogenase [Pseudobdellovibrionaceae bacterium]
MHQSHNETENNTPNQNDIESRIFKLGKEILNAPVKNQKSVFNKDWWYGQIMDWSMRNEAFKVSMFRFVDVLPTLGNSSEVAQHMKEYFTEGKTDGKLPSIFNFGVGVGSLAPGLMAAAVKKNVEQMAKMFITGERPKDAIPVLKKARNNNLAFTVDLLGEATLSEQEAQDYFNRYIELIEQLSADQKSFVRNEVLDTDSFGDIPAINVSVKLTSLYSQINVKDWDNTVETLKDRLRPILRSAIKNNVFLNLDMESYHYKDLTIDVFEQIISEDEFRQWPHFGIVMQAYLRESLADCKRMVDIAKRRETPFSIRLVKGAYWDYETIHAKQEGWPTPVYTNKMESDANFEDCTDVLLEGYPHLKLAVGSHNVRSICHAIVKAEALGIPKNGIELQMLYGMADQIKYTLIEKGYRVREYATVGELIPGMAYLVRRLLENTSNESFLKNKFADNVPTEDLMRAPKTHLVKSEAYIPDLIRFNNHPLYDFAKKDPRDRMHQALERVRAKLPIQSPVVIDNQILTTNETLSSVCPFDPSLVIGTFAKATNEQAEQAVQSAKQAGKDWSLKMIGERALVLNRLAEIIEKNRDDLIALEVFEVGKTWSEADGDITEAIDFLKYYARDILRVGVSERVGHVPGEVSLYHYRPRGVTAVIAPWNFPLAILTGMVSAAIVTGNTVVMKPAEQSTIIAWKLMEMLQEAGCPKGVVNFLPGLGEDVGAYLVDHKDVATISFTGSKAVGLDILNKASTVRPGQKSLKRCIIEMGGKNAVIIDSDADLDEAVAGVIYSAFAFQGQKCSAASRIVVLDSIYDRFLDRLVEAAKSLHVGPGSDPKSFYTAVIDEESQKRILSMIESAKSTSRMVFQGEVPPTGYYVPHTIFADVQPDADIAHQELFGPVLAVIRAKDIDEAIHIVNSVEYGLTGGIYSRSPNNIERARQEIEVGNLYINRSITGALVNRHPFGGYKMSGLGSKTGGPDYLKQYMEPRVSTENTMRRGFAPSEES